MENSAIARILGETGDLLDLSSGNAFKARAYHQAAQIIGLLPSPVSELWREDKLVELPAIGERIAQHIGELLSTGHFKEHDQLMKKVPPGLLELLQVEGVGPKTVRLVWKKLGVKDLAGFETACHDGAIARLPRMGQARVHAMAAAIDRHRARRGRVPLFRALPVAEAIVARLRKVPGVSHAMVAGSARRRKDTVGDVDLLVASADPERVMRAFREAPEIEGVAASGPTKCTARLTDGLQADLRVVPPQGFGAALHYFTGSKAHNIAVRTKAMRLGLKLSEYGVFDARDKRIAGATEEEVFRAVGLPFIPPELREGAGEVEAAEHGSLPKLLEEDDVLGDLHVHSDASSDGHSTLAELSAEGQRLHRAYLAITDHSVSRPLGLDAAALHRRVEAITAFDERREGPRLLAGIEVDILANGALDLPDAALGELGFVVGSVHAHLRDPAPTLTARMVKAIRSGQLDALGHPSGRLLDVRDPSAFDLPAVLAAARDEGVAIEINASPDRLDLDEKAARQARDSGVKLVISSDAHHVSQLANLRYGVWVARRAWLEAKDVLNTLSFGPLVQALERRRRHAS